MLIGFCDLYFSTPPRNGPCPNVVVPSNYSLPCCSVLTTTTWKTEVSIVCDHSMLLFFEFVKLSFYFFLF